MTTIGVAKKVALETTRKSAPGKRKKTRLLKDDIDNACKNMKMLATAPGLNNATKVTVTAVEADSIHLDAFASRSPAFIALLTGEFFTCCKRIRRGDSMISFLLELA